MQTTDKYLLTGIVIVFFVFVSIAVLKIGEYGRRDKLAICGTLRSSLQKEAFWGFTDKIQAKAVYSYDFTNNLPLFAQNENAILPLASLTKLMTARVALKQLPLLDFYTIKDTDVLPEDALEFYVGESFRINDLLRAALISSSNSAATMLSSASGISQDGFSQAMNVEAQNLKLPTLSYKSATGLDNISGATAFGSARDNLFLLYKNFDDYPKIFTVNRNAETISSTAGREITLNNTNYAIDKMSLLIASKTGYTVSAGGNLAILWNVPDGKLLGGIIIGSTEDGRFDDMVNLYSATNTFEASLSSLPAICR